MTKQDKAVAYQEIICDAPKSG